MVQWQLVLKVVNISLWGLEQTFIVLMPLGAEDQQLYASYIRAIYIVDLYSTNYLRRDLLA